MMPVVRSIAASLIEQDLVVMLRKSAQSYIMIGRGSTVIRVSCIGEHGVGAYYDTDLDREEAPRTTLVEIDYVLADPNGAAKRVVDKIKEAIFDGTEA